jgi:hypothetical protein
MMALVALTVVTGALAAQATCRSIRGTIVLESLSGAACSSPVDVCAIMRFRGDLAGKGKLTASSLTTSADTPTTGVIFLTGDTKVGTDDGRLRRKDAAALGTTGRRHFADLATIVGGDGQWTGASGQLMLTGRFPTEARDGNASYTGLVCTA